MHQYHQVCHFRFDQIRMDYVTLPIEITLCLILRISISLLPHLECVLQHPSLILICILDLFPKDDFVDTELRDLTCECRIIEKHVVCLQGSAHVSYLILWKELADLRWTESGHDEGGADDIDGDVLIFQERRANASTEAHASMLRSAILRIDW